MCTLSARQLFFESTWLLVLLEHLPYPLHSMLVASVMLKLLLHHDLFESTYLHVRLWWDCWLIEINLAHFYIASFFICHFSTIWCKVLLRILDVFTGILIPFCGSNRTVLINTTVAKYVLPRFQGCLGWFLLFWLLYHQTINLRWKQLFAQRTLRRSHVLFDLNYFANLILFHHSPNI